MDGVLYIQASPRCPVHGQMNYTPAGIWVCHGFDGEGCDHTAQPERDGWMPVYVTGVEDFTWRRA